MKDGWASVMKRKDKKLKSLVSYGLLHNTCVYFTPTVFLNGGPLNNMPLISVVHINLTNTYKRVLMILGGFFKFFGYVIPCNTIVTCHEP